MRLIGKLADVIHDVASIFTIGAFKTYDASASELTQSFNFNFFHRSTFYEPMVKLKSLPNVLFRECSQRNLLVVFSKSFRFLNG